MTSSPSSTWRSWAYSHDPKEFSSGVYRELKAHGYELHPVNPHADEIDGDACVATVADLPDGIDGAVVMVPPAASASVVQACIDRGIPQGVAAQGCGTVLRDRRGGRALPGARHRGGRRGLPDDVHGRRSVAAPGAPLGP